MKQDGESIYCNIEQSLFSFSHGCGRKPWYVHHACQKKQIKVYDNKAMAENEFNFQEQKNKVF